MLKHIVIFKLKDRSPASLSEVAQKLRSMEGKIPELLSIEVGENLVDSERAYDIALVCGFADRQALDRYIVHPAHQEISAFMAQRREHSCSVDYNG